MIVHACVRAARACACVRACVCACMCACKLMNYFLYLSFSSDKLADEAIRLALSKFSQELFSMVVCVWCVWCGVGGVVWCLTFCVLSLSSIAISTKENLSRQRDMFTGITTRVTAMTSIPSIDA